jgi:hypothetical protein
MGPGPESLDSRTGEPMIPSSPITTLFLDIGGFLLTNGWDISQVSPINEVHIDDRPMFVEVAQGLEIRGIIHKGYETTQKAHEAIGLSLRI